MLDFWYTHVLSYLMTIQEIASASAQIQKLLTPLAEKIVRTSEMVYGLFMKQVYANTIKSAIYMLIELVVSTIFILNVKKMIKSINDESSFVYKNDLELLIIFTLVFGGGVVFGLVFDLLGRMGDITATLINPDFATIQLILRTIKQ